MTAVALWGRPRRELASRAWWLVAGAAAAALCAGAASAAGVAGGGAAGAPWWVAALGCAALGACLYEPRLVGPLIAVALPLEISKLWFPFLLTREELGGGLGETSIVDAGRLAVAAGLVVWVVRPGRARVDVLPTSPMTLPLAVLFAVYALSTAWAFDAGAARTETLRLLFSLGTFALVPFFVRDRASLRWTLYALVASAGALALVGIWQEATGSFLWNEGLGAFGERRINATFADPNHFARLLVCAIVVACVLWPRSSWGWRAWVLGPAVVLSLATLLFTGSRGAWAAAVVALPLVLLALPLERRARWRVAAAGAGAVVGLAVVVAAVSPFFAKRLDTLTFGVEALGARRYLAEAGLQMFADHPLTGVGAGGFQYAFEEDYYGFKDPKIKAEITAPHTSAVTVLAELGVVGAMAVLFVVWRWWWYVGAVAAGGDAEVRQLTRGLGICTLVVLLASQTEGRFLEDPYLWLFVGLVVAAGAVGEAEGRAVRAGGAG